MLTIQDAPISLGIHALPLLLGAIFIVAALLCLRRYTSNAPTVAAVHDRDGHTEDTFVHAMADLGLSPRISRLTYRHLQRRHSIAFPILAQDRFQQELGLGLPARSQILRRLLVENERQLLPGLGAGSIVTVEDLVATIQRSPLMERERAA